MVPIEADGGVELFESLVERKSDPEREGRQGKWGIWPISGSSLIALVILVLPCSPWRALFKYHYSTPNVKEFVANGERNMGANFRVGHHGSICVSDSTRVGVRQIF